MFFKHIFDKNWTSVSHFTTRKMAALIRARAAPLKWQRYTFPGRRGPNKAVKTSLKSVRAIFNYNFVLWRNPLVTHHVS